MQPIHYTALYTPPLSRACFAEGTVADAAAADASGVAASPSLPPVAACFFTELGDREPRPCEVGFYSDGGAELHAVPAAGDDAQRVVGLSREYRGYSIA